MANSSQGNQNSVAPFPAIVGTTPVFSSVTVAAATMISTSYASISTSGTTTSGDGGAAIYTRAGGATSGGFQSADGQFWQLAPNQEMSPQMFGAIGNGSNANAAADTAGINAALATGRPVLLNGYYIINASLTQNLPIQNGQIVRGYGRLNPQQTGPSRSVIKPLAGVTPAINIFGISTTYMQGVTWRDFTIDLTNLVDTTASMGMQTAYSFDMEFNNINVINDGANKRGFNLTLGTFTTTLIRTFCTNVNLIGQSNSFGVTTTTFINHDGVTFTGNFVVGTKIFGGSWQGAGNKFNLTNCAGFIILSDIEGTGIYLNFIGGNNGGFISMSTLGGFTGTYSAGTPAGPSMLLDIFPVSTQNVFSLTTGEIHLTESTPAAGSYSSFHSNSLSFPYYVAVGRLGEEVAMAIAANNADFMSNSVPGDGCVFGNVVGNALILGAGGNPLARLSVANGFQMVGGLAPASLATGQALLTPYIWAGAGVPSNAQGANGDFYLNSSAPGAGVGMYQKRAGSWVGITT